MSIHATPLLLRLKERPPHARHVARDCAKIWLLSFTLHYVRHLVRYLRAPLDESMVTKFEFARLAALDIRSRTAQMFLAWRRSALIIAALPAIGSCVVDLIHAYRHFVLLRRSPAQFQTVVDATRLVDAGIAAELGMLGAELLEPLVLVFEVLLVVTAMLNVFGAGAAISALVHWRDHRLSRRRLLLAWATTLVQPLLLAVIPVRLVIQAIGYVPGSLWIGEHEITTTELEAALEHVQLEVGVIFAILALLAIAPLVLAVFPAIIRGGFYAKKLVPESPLPGWAIAVTPPLYIVSASAFMAMINQIVGSPLLLLAITASLLGPVAYTLTSRWLTRPTDHEHLGPRMLWIRGLANLGSTIGTAALILFMLRAPELYEAVLTPTHVVEFAIEVARNYLIATIVATDLLVWLLLVMHIQETRVIDGNPALRAGLDARLEELAQLEQPHREVAV